MQLRINKIQSSAPSTDTTQNGSEHRHFAEEFDRALHQIEEIRAGEAKVRPLTATKNPVVVLHSGVTNEDVDSPELRELIARLRRADALASLYHLTG